MTSEFQIHPSSSDEKLRFQKDRSEVADKVEAMADKSVSPAWNTTVSPIPFLSFDDVVFYFLNIEGCEITFPRRQFVVAQKTPIHKD